MTNQALTLEFGQHGQRLLDGSLRWPHDASNTEIDDIQSVEAEVPEVVVNAVDELLAGKSRNPRLVFTPARTQLGDDDESFRIGVERPFDDLIGDMRTIEVAGVDVIDAARNGFPQYRDRSVNVARRSPHVWAGKLHRAIAHSVQSHGGAGEREGAAKVWLIRHSAGFPHDSKIAGRSDSMY